MPQIPPIFTDNRMRIILGSGCILFGLLNGVLYFRELAIAAQSKSDISELNQRRIAQATQTPSPVSTVATAPTPEPSAMINQSTPKLAPATPKPTTASLPKAAAPTQSSTATSGKVKISTATEAEFDTLPGIGPTKAKAIIDYRATHPFTKLEDLKNVTGIGDKTYEQLLPFIEL